ncbi:MAG TPA: nucleotidyltransferase family protein [Dehalococcoidia bacterium]|nr:nucleotidyltransferase family protein [Dehalococcoidia bacterium]
MTIAALILAAGESTRMGRPKPLLPWGGTTLVAWQVAQMREAGADDVVVVLGHRAEEIRAALSPDARAVVNEAYREGRATSLRAGAEALADDVEAIFILSVDQPRPAWLSRRLIERWRETGTPIVSPRFTGGGYGHPILVAGSLLPELRDVSEETLGLRAVILRHASEAASVGVTNRAIDVDLNTPAEYEAALAAFERGDWAETES